MAERALRHFAVQRKISGSFLTSGITDYLMLLGITQTCRFQNKPLLEFLMSGEKDIDQFKQSKRRKNTKPVGQKDYHLTDDVQKQEANSDRCHLKLVSASGTTAE